MTSIDDIMRTVPEPPNAHMRVEPVEYREGETVLEGLLADDIAATGKRPGVLVMHDWFGVNEHVQARATMLARLGYIAFAPDIYGKGIRPTSGETVGITQQFYDDIPLFRARVLAGYQRLLAHPDVDRDRIVVMGYCFGGAAALELARAGAKLAGVVSFHGTLLVHEPSDAAAITGRVLVLTGGADPYVPDSVVSAWQDELRSAPNVEWEVVTYSGAMHAFAVPGADDPDHGVQYQERADRLSWKALEEFLADVFGDHAAQ